MLASSQVASPPTDPNPKARLSSEVALDEIEEVITKALEKIRQIKNIVKKKNENDEYTKELFTYSTSLVGSRNTNLMDGEWLEWKIFYIANVCRKMELDCLATVIKEALRDMYPNVTIFPAVEKQQGEVSFENPAVQMLLFEHGEASFQKKSEEQPDERKFLK